MARETHTFSQIPRAEIPRSVFNRSHNVKTAFNETNLIPIYVDEALPGDTINMNASFFARLATPVVPIFDNLYIDIFFFAVPNRLVWENWQKFMGEQNNPTDSTDFTIPIVRAGATGFAKESIYDYMGIPPGVPNLEVSALPLRAYDLIWHEWFRDQNLQLSGKPAITNGPDQDTWHTLRPRAKRHDYFTSCLPWPQKGDGVELPLGTTAPVIWNVGTLEVANPAITSNTNPTNLSIPNPAASPQGTLVNLEADLSSAASATINSLRQAFQIQKLLERDARGGTRYTEIIRSHFGVISPDARLQRPEFLGGGTVYVNVNPVPQTSASGAYADTPQGSLAAYAVAAKSGIGFSKAFTEHTILIGLAHIRADLNYQQGLNRMWSRRTRYDFYWPAFAHLGEQAVLNKEIYCQGPNAINPATTLPYDDEAFGYQERYAEYRYFPNMITGKMRSDSVTPAESLDVWHLAQEFSALPALNSNFIIDAPPLDRVVAVTNEPKVLMDAHFSIKAARPMPTYSVPGFIDHF